MNGKTTDMSSGDGTRRGQGFALLIDADNISLECLGRAIDGLMQRYPCPVRRAYRNFQDHEAWRKFCATEAILPVQTLNPGAKNAADLALVIDAMDLLHRGGIEGLVIVSDDSDFSRLAIRFREAGIPVIGYGTEKARKSYRKACETFHLLTAIAKTKPKTETVQPKAMPVLVKAEQGGKGINTKTTSAIKTEIDLVVANAVDSDEQKSEVHLITESLEATIHDAFSSLQESKGPSEQLTLKSLEEAIKTIKPTFNFGKNTDRRMISIISRSRGFEIVGTDQCRRKLA